MNTHMQNFYLANDKLVRAKDYVTAFDVSYTTAKKMFHSDREELIVNFLMYSHFWRLYGRFPEESFCGVWREMEVQKGTKKANNGNIGATKKSRVFERV